MENGAAQIVGRETVQYVSNIYKYYIAYSMIADRAAAEAEAVRKMQQTQGTAKP